MGIPPQARPFTHGVEHYVDPATDTLLAIVVRSDFHGGQYNFMTPDDFPMQLGVNFYAPGDRIQPHLHVQTSRDVTSQQELIVMKRGRAVLHLYTDQRELAADIELRAGDCVLLAHGGHGFDVLEETQLIEAKQGPYLGVGEKIKFDPSR